jgi:hypothetical protein
LVQEFNFIGLQVNLAKCHLWGPTTNHALSPLPPSHSAKAIPLLPYPPGSGFMVLGGPLNFPTDNTVTNKAWEANLTHLQSTIQRLQDLPELQSRFLLLKHCLDACRLQHLMRSSPFHQAQPYVQQATTLIRHAFDALVGTTCPDQQWHQACLPTRMGGFGLKSPTLIHPSARLSALLSFHRSSTRSVGVPSALYCLAISDMGSVIGQLQNYLGLSFEPLGLWSNPGPPGAILASPPYSTQKWWTDAVYAALADRLPSQCTAREQARLALTLNSWSTTWADCVVPPTATSAIPSPHFRLLLKWTLGIPLLPVATLLPPCPLCQDVLDPFSDHFVTCNQNGCAGRHNRFRDFLASFCRKSGIPHMVEQGPHLNDATRPGDLLLNHWDNGRDVVVDLLISHPLGLTQLPFSATRALRHTLLMEEGKKAKYGSHPDLLALGWCFAPAGFSTFASPGPGASRIMHDLIGRATADLSLQDTVELKLNTVNWK